MSGVVRTQKIMRNRIGEIQPFLHLEEPFTVLDVDEHPTRPHDTTKLLHENDVIEKVGTTLANGHNIGQWRWDDKEKAELERWLENEETYPRCQHRVTIHNPEWAEELACAVCGTEYTQETVKALL